MPRRYPEHATARVTACESAERLRGSAALRLESVGRRLGSAARRAGLRGAGDDERRARVGPRQAGSGGVAGRAARPCAGAHGGRRRAVVGRHASGSSATTQRAWPRRCGCSPRRRPAARSRTTTRRRQIDELEQAAERVAAAAEAARRDGLVLTARCEGYLYGGDDLDDTIARLVAYRDAGADCLYAPGLADPGQIAAVVQAVRHRQRPAPAGRPDRRRSSKSSVSAASRPAARWRVPPTARCCVRARAARGGHLDLRERRPEARGPSRVRLTEGTARS